MRTGWMHISGIILCLVLLAVGGLTARASACPSCKVAVQSSDGPGGAGGGDSGNAARGYYWSILAMLTILSLVGGGLIRLMVRASREVPAVPPDPAPGPSSIQHI